MILQIPNGMIRILARAIHGRRGLFLADHFDKSVHKLQYGPMSAGKKVGPINVKPRINDALVEAVVLAAPRPEIRISARAFKIPRLDGNNAP